MQIRRCAFTLLIIPGFVLLGSNLPNTGGLALAFDDGFANWMVVVAPELQKVHGKASGFVNNKNVPGRIRFGDLRRLRDDFNWEIGTHTFHHHHAPAFTRTQGLAAWEQQQLLASLEQFGSEDLHPRVLAFPYNAFTPDLTATALRHVESYRKAAPLALVRIPPGKGAHPETSFDLAAYIPPQMLDNWMAMAASQNATLFLYGHVVLPDEHFHRGTVRDRTKNRLIAEDPLPGLPPEETWVLVPDITRRVQRKDDLTILSIEGHQVHISGKNLSSLTQPGAIFLMGPANAIPLSYFQGMLQSARKYELRFLTISEAIRKDSIPHD